MWDANNYFLLGSVIVASRWLASLANCTLQTAMIVSLMLTGVLWGATPVLITISAVELQERLASIMVLIAIASCFEAWLLTHLVPGKSYLSPVSILALLYLQLLLFQSGWLPVSFDVQTGFYMALLAVFFLVYRVCFQFFAPMNSLSWHGVALWLLTWGALGIWPQSIRIDNQQYLLSSLLLIGLLLLIVVMSFYLHPRIKCLGQLLRGMR